MFTRISNTLVLPVIDKMGVKVDEREFVNVPLVELFANEKPVIIDWLAHTENRPSLDELMAPIEYKGQKYYGCYAWGSSVKMGQTIGLTHDLPNETIVKYAEDGVRVQRWLLAKGYFGGFKTEHLKVLVVKPGTVIDGCGPVEDGFGYIDRKTATHSASAEKRITLSRSKENYTFWQRLDWNTIAAEQIPLIGEAVNEAGSLENMLFEAPQSFEQKKALCELEPLMFEHPFVANALTRVSADFHARLSTCGVTGGVYRVAVPTTMPKVCWPGHTGKVGLYRTPIDSNGSIQAVEIEDMPEYQAEAARIAALEVIQYTLATTTFAAKGCLGVVEKLPEGYDLIICSEDIKLSDQPVGEIRKLFEIELAGAVCVFTQWWSAGSAVGVNAAWAKDLMGLDHDGDGVTIFSCEDKPALFQAMSNLPYGETPKLTKTHTRIVRNKTMPGFGAVQQPQDVRPLMILKSMANIVGFATNVMSTVKAIKNQEYVARILGFTSVAKMDAFLNYAVKVGTDGFKTDVDTDKVATQLAVVQANLSKHIGGTFPVCDWPNSAAFHSMVPVVITKVCERQPAGIPKSSRLCLVNGKETVLNDTELHEAIKPVHEGTVAQICRLTLKAVKDIMGEMIQVRPLADFRNWAFKVTDTSWAEEIQDWYNASVHRVNWSDPDSIMDFKALYLKEIDRWLATGVDKKLAASQLWYVAHNARSSDASAASVFMGFPEEAAWIVKNKPGCSKNKFSTILTGVRYQVPSLKEATVEVEVVEVSVQKGAKLIVRKCVVGEVDGQLQPGMPYPKNMIGIVAVNADQPKTGKYTAMIHQATEGSWTCSLS